MSNTAPSYLEVSNDLLVLQFATNSVFLVRLNFKGIPRFLINYNN